MISQADISQAQTLLATYERRASRWEDAFTAVNGGRFYDGNGPQDDVESYQDLAGHARTHLQQRTVAEKKARAAHKGADLFAAAGEGASRRAGKAGVADIDLAVLYDFKKAAEERCALMRADIFDQVSDATRRRLGSRLLFHVNLELESGSAKAARKLIDSYERPNALSLWWLKFRYGPGAFEEFRRDLQLLRKIVHHHDDLSRQIGAHDKAACDVEKTTAEAIRKFLKAKGDTPDLAARKKKTRGQELLDDPDFMAAAARDPALGLLRDYALRGRGKVPGKNEIICDLKRLDGAVDLARLQGALDNLAEGHDRKAEAEHRQFAAYDSRLSEARAVDSDFRKIRRYEMSLPGALRFTDVRTALREAISDPEALGEDRFRHLLARARRRQSQWMDDSRQATAVQNAITLTDPMTFVHTPGQAAAVTYGAVSATKGTLARGFDHVVEGMVEASGRLVTEFTRAARGTYGVTVQALKKGLNLIVS